VSQSCCKLRNIAFWWSKQHLVWSVREESHLFSIVAVNHKSLHQLRGWSEIFSKILWWKQIPLKKETSTWFYDSMNTSLEPKQTVLLTLSEKFVHLMNLWFKVESSIMKFCLAKKDIAQNPHRCEAGGQTSADRHGGNLNFDYSFWLFVFQNWWPLIFQTSAHLSCMSFLVTLDFPPPATCVADVSTIDFADVYEHFGWPGCWETHEVQISLHQKDRFGLFLEEHFGVCDPDPRFSWKKRVNWVHLIEMSVGIFVPGSYAPSQKIGEFPR